MAKEVRKLSARGTATVTKPGRHSDGAGLYLNVTETGARSWVFMWKVAGRRREMGLGSARDVPLARAREMAAEYRTIVSAGRDPLQLRAESRATERQVPTFGECADEFVAAKQSEWRNEKHRAQWAMTLIKYAAPLRKHPVDAIDTAAVLSVLKPIWQTRPETASRFRGRIEQVLDAAKAQGHRTGENPARWRGHLDKLLAKRQKLTRGHHAAMPYAEVPEFLGRLRERQAESVSALALEFAILTAARSGEVLGMRWQEIDKVTNVWTVPAQRMKTAREHRVPLSPRALAVLKEAAKARTGDFVFPGSHSGRPLSVMAMEMVLRRMNLDSVTVHGFRSAFRDWAGNETHFAREVAEAALAHVIGDAAEQAYRRGDALEKRRALMEAWANYCLRSPVENVVPLERGRK
jgi:integrase